MLKSDAAQNTVSNHQGEEPNMGEDEGEEAPDANQAFWKSGGVWMFCKCSSSGPFRSCI